MRIRRTRAIVFACAAAGVVGGVAFELREANAQRFNPRRPASWVVGPPPGAAPMQRVDGRRSGLATSPLPSRPLRVAWRKTTGFTLDQPALSGPDSTLVVVSLRGDVTFLDETGEERASVRVTTAQGSPGPAAMTSDGTVVYITNNGDVVGVHRSSARSRFTTRIGGERNLRAAPLAFDDGGFVAATMTDLVILDAEGNVRTRVSLPESPAAPLIAAGDKIIAVALSGTVFGWTPGHEPVRLGSFGGPIDGGAALRDGGTLVAVIDGNHLTEVDITHGGLSTRSLAPQGLYLGPPSVRSASGGASLATLLAITPSRGFVVTIDGAGQELVRAPIASFTPVLLADGGAPPLVAPPHVGTIIDDRGTVAFASTDGHIGIVTPEGVVDMIDDTPCAKGSRAGVTGLTPFGSGAFAVTCESGTIVAITGGAAGARDGESRGKAPAPPAPPAPSASSDKLRARPDGALR